MKNNKINFEEIKYLVPDYITGNLDANEKLIVENAIKESEEVNAFYKETKATFEFARSVKFKEPSQQYWNNLLPRIHQRMESEKERKAARNPLSILWKILVPVAAVIIIFIIYQLATSPEKQIVKNNTFIEEKKEIKDNNTEKQQNENQNQKQSIDKQTDKKKDNIEQENPDNSKQNNSPHKTTKRTAKTDYESVNYGNLANNNNPGDNMIKENVMNDDKDEFASAEIDESSITVSGQNAGFDEEVERDLNKLDDNEQNSLLEQLSGSNL
jgi:hypothetical protein